MQRRFGVHLVLWCAPCLSITVTRTLSRRIRVPASGYAFLAKYHRLSAVGRFQAALEQGMIYLQFMWPPFPSNDKHAPWTEPRRRDPPCSSSLIGASDRYSSMSSSVVATVQKLQESG